MTQHWTWPELHTALRLISQSEHTLPPDLLDQLLDQAPQQAPPRYNLCPSENALVLRADAGRMLASPVRWGIPRPGPDSRSALVGNARSETVDRLPMFRDAFAHARCLVPASGFYEWQATGDRQKQPWYFTPADAPMCFFAGIIADSGEGQAFATITAPTPEACRTNIHPRMPSVILPEHAGAWLGLAPAPSLAPLSCLRTFGSDHAIPSQAHPVSKRVNRTTNDDATLTAPIEPEPGLFG